MKKSKTLEKIRNTNVKRDYLIPLLQDLQDEYGYLAKESLLELSQIINVPVSKIYGVATFYNQFRFQPLGKYHIQICRGTACHVKNSLEILNTLQRELKIEPGKTTKDGLFSLEVVACIGACGLAPVIKINEDFYSKADPKKIIQLLNEFRSKNE